jgi:hypothetical protein
MALKTMNRLLKIIIFAVLAQGVSVVTGSPAKDDSLRFEVLLTSKILSDNQLNETFINSLDITSNQLVLLSTRNKFYLLGWGGIKAAGQNIPDAISSFAYTPDGLLMIVHNKDLCTLDSLGNISTLFGLPDQDMGITAGEYVMYVYDRNKGNAAHGLYAIARGGKYSRLFDVPAPISSVVEMKNSILFATNNSLFSYQLTDKTLKVLTVLPKDNIIKSIAVDTSSNRIYISTANSIYALKDSGTVIITEEIGGILRFLNDGLIVFNPDKKLLIRIVGIDKKITSEIQAVKAGSNEKKPTGPLTNSNIINLVKTKLSDDLIIKVISSSEVNFNLGVDSMIFLSNQNVSSAVIMAMKNAMKQNTGNISGNIKVPENQSSQNITAPGTNNTTIMKFYIIAGSYPSEQQANEAVADLKRKEFPDAEVLGKNSAGSYRIAYKSYATNGEAAQDLIKIRQTINSTAWIFETK